MADQSHMKVATPPKLIVWSERYSVGISRIDEQHQRLIDLINDLHGAMLEKQEEPELSKILDGLAAYAVSHFATEETLMKKHKHSRDVIAALEKGLCDALKSAGYAMINAVHSRQPIDEGLLKQVLAAFSSGLPKLKNK